MKHHFYFNFFKFILGYDGGKIIGIVLLGLVIMGTAVISYSQIQERFFPKKTAPLYKIGSGHKDVDVQKVLDSKPVRKADADLNQAVEGVIQEIHQFFDSARDNSPEFAEMVLGWGGKWRLVSDHLPGTRDDRFDMFIQENFQRCIFSEDTLREMLHDASVEFETQIQGIENEMLRDLENIFPELFTDSEAAFADDKALLTRYHEVLSQAAQNYSGTVQGDLMVGTLGFVSGEVLGTIAARVFTSCGTKMATSTGILSAGAASSGMTLGISLVIGIIADAIVSYVWDKCADPVGTLAGKVTESLDQMETLLINGDENTPGLRIQLNNSIQKYIEQRNQALCIMVQQDK